MRVQVRPNSEPMVRRPASSSVATGTTAPPTVCRLGTRTTICRIRTRTSGLAWHTPRITINSTQLRSERTLPLGRRSRKTIIIRLVGGHTDMRVRTSESRLIGSRRGYAFETYRRRVLSRHRYGCSRTGCEGRLQASEGPEGSRGVQSGQQEQAFAIEGIRIEWGVCLIRI